MDRSEILQLARECSFDLAGIAPAEPLPEAFAAYMRRNERGYAAGMTYLTDYRAEVRRDPRNLLPSAKSILVCGVLYNSREPYSTDVDDDNRAWISRYAWGDDYHDVLRSRFEELVKRLPPCESRICVDTAPLLERAYAARAGLGWIGKNTLLINQQQGSWFFLGELLLSLELEPDEPAPFRCGTCTRCIDACPTQAIVPAGDRYELDSRLCISYHTIESREATPENLRGAFGGHVFGCDICQDVCPWNHRAPVSIDPAFQPREFAPPLDRLADLTEDEFREMFRKSPVWRTKYRGFLRNVCTAMGNAPKPEYRPQLERLARHSDPAVVEHARWALERIGA